MLNRTINIITSRNEPYKTCVMGNEGIVRAAVESGVNGVFSYPGTPSTEISEVFNHIYNFQHNPVNKEKYPDLTASPVYFEYSINEKIAMEKAIAYSIGNKSAMCVMKNVGMNVASDPLMSVTYQTIGGPLVIIVCDDPGCHSSSNEQDSRYWGPMASVPVFNPATPQDAYDMVKQAFVLSAKIKLPVIVRTTTRVSHTRGIITYGKIEKLNREAQFERLPEHINIPARTAAAHTKLLNKLHSDFVTELFPYNTKLYSVKENVQLGIICSGVSVSYTKEILTQNKIDDKADILDIGFIYPFPEKEVIAFLKKGYKRILILEELDPFIENNIRNLAQKNHLNIELYGKGFSGLVATGEFSIDLISKVLEDFTKINFTSSKNIPLDHPDLYLQQLPPRPPALCAGCPHRATFYLLKLAIPRDQSELIMCGDIGCFGLGALPPLKMIDTINHMGMSISMAQGLYESFHDSEKEKKVVALLGDGTFFHSGLSSLVNAVYTRANILVIIFDNRTIGMTGHQEHPGASHQSKYKEIDIPPLLKGLGIEVVETINPFNIHDSYEKVERALAHNGVSVIVSKAPCIFLPDFKEKINKKMVIAVDPLKCNTCANHEDKTLACSRCHIPKNNLSRAKAKIMAENSIPGEDQLCPANICNHGFFNSILEGNYKEAVEIVRDKMLFARTCGDVCHRPCELFSERNNAIPIKLLKKTVSSFDEYFYDFSAPINRVKNAIVKNKKVAVVGAGPSGLSAAYDLVQHGYSVTIFEKDNKPGGMITHAIPSFRMDKNGFEFEAMQLAEMGVEFKFNSVIGQNISIDQLKSDFDAVIIAIGLQQAKKLDIIEKNVPEQKRLNAIQFLRSFNDSKNILSPSSVTVVIGGGNSAMDAARSVKKLHPNNTVIVTCIENTNNMPAFFEEIEHARKEGIEIINESFVKEVKIKGEKVLLSLFNFNKQDKHINEIECDYVITAIGQTGDSEFIAANNFTSDKTGRITQSIEKISNKIFFAGDIHSQNNISLIGAIASGKKSAIDVRKLLENYSFEYEGEKALHRLNTQAIPNNHLNSNDKIELESYNLFQSCQKCNHCIDNFGCPAMVKTNGKVQIDMSRCTLCGLCIDVCPNNAINWVIESDEELEPETNK